MAALGDPRPGVVRPGRRRPLLELATVLIYGSIAIEVLLLVGVLHRFQPAPGPGPSRPSFTWTLGTTSPSAWISVSSGAVQAGAIVTVLILLTRAYIAAGGSDAQLPVRPVWLVVSWLVPCMNLIAPYTLMRFTFDRLLGDGWRRLLRWWWVAWVVSSIGPFVSSSTVENGWQTPTPPFAMWEAATDIAFGLLTLVVVRRLASATARSTSPGSRGSP